MSSSLDPAAPPSSDFLSLRSLKYSLGELYDHRSNVDVTGQQQALSLKSALYAQSAVDMLEAEGGEQSEAAQRGELLAMSLLLRGRGLCNFALDGDSESMQAKQAFEVAEQDLMRSVAMMEGAGSDRTAKAMMSVGYLHYCKAGCTMNTEVSSMNQVVACSRTAPDRFCPCFCWLLARLASGWLVGNFFGRSLGLYVLSSQGEAAAARLLTREPSGHQHTGGLAPELQQGRGVLRQVAGALQ